MKVAGIVNKHAGIQGMPKMDLAEKEAIVQTLMALRGNGTCNHKEAHAKGKLLVAKAPLKYSRIIDPAEDAPQPPVTGIYVEQAAQADAGRRAAWTLHMPWTS